MKQGTKSGSVSCLTNQRLLEKTGNVYRELINRENVEKIQITRNVAILTVKNADSVRMDVIYAAEDLDQQS